MARKQRGDRVIFKANRYIKCPMLLAQTDTAGELLAEPYYDKSSKRWELLIKFDEWKYEGRREVDNAIFVPDNCCTILPRHPNIPVTYWLHL